MCTWGRGCLCLCIRAGAMGPCTIWGQRRERVCTLVHSTIPIVPMNVAAIAQAKAWQEHLFATGLPSPSVAIPLSGACMECTCPTCLHTPNSSGAQHDTTRKSSSNAPPAP
ncbi:unnamed protein product, partial [Discosporangium mesarthrocarpum]